MVELRLLGPVAVERDGEPVALRRPLELALLTRLALNPGRAVAVERLIDDLWGERAPVNQTASLRTLVYRLRKSLRPDDDLVVWDRNGYRLAVEVDQVDSARFEQMASQVRAGTGVMPRVERRALLRRAAELWRGPALAGLENFPFALAHVGRLTAERMAVLEEGFAADLDAGGHVAVVPELERTVAEFPFEERFWAQLVTALYRSGSQASALRACARLRKLLAEELGLEPSPMIRDLEDAVLTQRTDLDWRPVDVRVCAPQLVPDFDPPRSMPTGSNLPFSTDRFVGRSLELKEIDRHREEHRLVTLAGPGGSGKTRLAIEAARTQLDFFHDGVWFIDLTAVADETGAVRALSSALGVSQGARPSIQQLAEALLTRRMLLVVDNCEHVLAMATRIVMTLLRRVPGLSVLATSREPLGVAGEAVVQVGALSLPSPEDFDRLRESDAVQLFLSRGRAAYPTFVGRDEDLVHVAEICRLVDGIPLAIELAAARLRAISVSELSVRLGERLAFLGTGVGQDGDRHHSMDAVVEWSYRLLEDNSRVLLRRLATFAGGFTIASAEQVCTWGVLEPLAVVDLLVGLVDKSLIQRLDLPSGPRYRMLEIIHDFTSRRLAESDEHDAARDRHLAWAIGVTGDLEAAIRTRAQDRALADVVVEHDNLRVARSWAIERNDPVGALRITTSAPIDAASDRERLLARLSEDAPNASQSVRARAEYTCVSVAFDTGAYERGVRHGQSAINLFHELGDTQQEGYAKMMTAFCCWGLGHADVGDQLAKAAALFGEDGDTMGRAYISWTLAQWLVEHGDDLELADSLAQQGVELFTAIGAEFGLAHAHEGLALIRLHTGKTDQAMRLILGAMVAFQSTAHLGCLAHAVDVAAICVAQRGDLESSAMLVGAAESLFDRAGVARRPWELAAYSRLHRRLASDLAPEPYDRARRRGRDMTADWTVNTVRQLTLTT